MVPERVQSSPTEPDHTIDDTRSDADRSSTLINALVGGVAGIVLFFIPFSTVLGGAVAGYLEGGDTSEGLKVGALAGLVMLVPFALFGAIGLALFMGVTGAPLAFGIFAFFGIAIGALYTVGLSAVGGIIGVYLEDEL